MTDRDRKILGVWDAKKAPLKLGFLIIFLQELHQISETKRKSIDLAFLGDNDNMDYIFLGTISSFLPKLGSLLFLGSGEELDEYFRYREIDYELWPPAYLYDRCSYVGSTLTVQELYKDSSKLFPLKINNKIRKFTIDTLGNILKKEVPIVVHLKNNPLEPESNARLDNWLELFAYCNKNCLPVKFILVGDDVVDSRYIQYENVALAKHYHGSLALYIGLIQHAFMFMGMASGFCNVALFSNVPYLIWKHPNHHAKEMEREFQGHSQFMFAMENQRFMRSWDTSENIIEEFQSLYRRLDQRAWIKRVYGKKNADVF